MVCTACETPLCEETLRRSRLHGREVSALRVAARVAQRARARVSRGRLTHEGDEEDAVGGGEVEVVRVLAKEVQQAEVGVLDYFEPLRTRRVQLLR